MNDELVLAAMKRAYTTGEITLEEYEDTLEEYLETGDYNTEHTVWQHQVPTKPRSRVEALTGHTTDDVKALATWVTVLMAAAFLAGLLVSTQAGPDSRFPVLGVGMLFSILGTLGIGVGWYLRIKDQGGDVW